MQYSKQGRVFHFTWEEDKLECFVGQIERHSGRTAAEVIWKTIPSNALIEQSNLNLSSHRSRTDMAKVLSKKCPDVAIETLETFLDQLCFVVMEQLRTGSSIEEIYTTDEVKPPEYLLYPLILKGIPTVLYGDGGSGKSNIAMLVSTCIQLPWTDNPFGWKTTGEPVKTLYLDWESSKDIFAWRLKRLKTGMGLPEYSLHYRYCEHSLGDDLEQIQQIIMDNKIGFIVVDSLAVAFGGDLREQQMAGDFFLNLRQLGVTSLLITHITKDETKKATPFGSVFFKNLARSVIEAKKAQEVGEDTLSVGLFHRKANETRLFKPIGFSINYNGSATTFSLQDVKAIPEFATGLPLKVQIAEVLTHGSMTTAGIAEELEANMDSIRAILNRNSKMFIKLGNEWGVRSNEV